MIETTTPVLSRFVDRLPWRVKQTAVGRHLLRTVKVREHRHALAVAGTRRLVIGAGTTRLQGWVSTDVDTLDVTREADWAAIAEPGSLDRLLAEHVFEHLTLPQIRAALTHAARFLRSGGRFRIAVPDGHRPDPHYLAHVSPPADGHQVLLNVTTLSTVIEQCGLLAEPLEYFDAGGQFHRRPWSPDDGYIERCAAEDRREDYRFGEVCYTSLIMDAVRPESRLRRAA